MTRRISLSAASIILLLAALVLSGQLQPSFAASDANHMPISVRIPIEYQVDGETTDTGTDTYVLTAAKAENPMPEGSSGGVKKIRISKPGRTDFGPMRISKPGAYDYTVHRLATEKKNVMKDAAVYHVRIAALNTGQANLIVTREGKGDKTQIIYRDSVKVPGIFHTPKTGDPINPVILIMICAIAAVVIVSLFVRMRNRRFR